MPSKKKTIILAQRFSNHGFADGSQRLREWVAKASKLPPVKEKDLRIQDFKSKNLF